MYIKIEFEWNLDWKTVLKTKKEKKRSERKDEDKRKKTIQKKKNVNKYTEDTSEFMLTNYPKRLQAINLL